MLKETRIGPGGESSARAGPVPGEDHDADWGILPPCPSQSPHGSAHYPPAGPPHGAGRALRPAGARRGRGGARRGGDGFAFRAARAGCGGARGRGGARLRHQARDDPPRPRPARRHQLAEPGRVRGAAAGVVRGVERGRKAGFAGAAERPRGGRARVPASGDPAPPPRASLPAHGRRGNHGGFGALSPVLVAVERPARGGCGAGRAALRLRGRQRAAREPADDHQPRGGGGGRCRGGGADGGWGASGAARSGKSLRGASPPCICWITLSTLPSSMGSSP
jgi:hypothetical protein